MSTDSGGTADDGAVTPNTTSPKPKVFMDNEAADLAQALTSRYAKDLANEALKVAESSRSPVVGVHYILEAERRLTRVTGRRDGHVSAVAGVLLGAGASGLISMALADGALPIGGVLLTTLAISTGSAMYAWVAKR